MTTISMIPASIMQHYTILLSISSCKKVQHKQSSPLPRFAPLGRRRPCQSLPPLSSFLAKFHPFLVLVHQISIQVTKQHKTSGPRGGINMAKVKRVKRKREIGGIPESCRKVKRESGKSLLSAGVVVFDEPVDAFFDRCKFETSVSDGEESQQTSDSSTRTNLAQKA